MLHKSSRLGYRPQFTRVNLFHLHVIVRYLHDCDMAIHTTQCNTLCVLQYFTMFLFSVPVAGCYCSYCYNTI